METSNEKAKGCEKGRCERQRDEGRGAVLTGFNRHGQTRLPIGVREVRGEERNGERGATGGILQRTADRRPQNRRCQGSPVHPVRRQQRPVQEGEMSGVKFSPGSVVATPGVLEEFRASGDDPLAYLIRHLAGDWGDVDEHDRNENELSLQHGWRLLSAYTLCTLSAIFITAGAGR